MISPLMLMVTILFFSFATFSLYTFFTIRYRKSSEPVFEKDQTFPKVSVLVPLKNLDDEIEANMNSLYLLDYPNLELLFGVDFMTDEVAVMLKKLQKRHPEIASKIIETGHSSNENPKVHKLVIMSFQSSGDLYWICDSNIRVNSNTLKKLVNEYIVNDSKIIFSPIRATGSHSIGSIIENAYINHFLSGNVISAWKLFKQQIIVGKSILMEKKTLERFGGFAYFKDYLAEDYMMGETYTQSKIPISTNCTWVTNINRNTTIKGFFSRMERWAKLRYHLKLPFYIMEIFLNPIMLALAAFFILGGTSGLIVLAASIALKLTLELVNFFYLNHEDRKKLRVILLLPFCIILKDIILFVVYFMPFFSSTVNWRGGKISIGKHTLISLSQENLLIDGA